MCFTPVLIAASASQLPPPTNPADAIASARAE